MKDIAVKLDGQKELEQKLSRLDKDVQGDVALRAVNAGAAVIERKAKINMDRKLKRRTGNLINSISTNGEKVGNGARATVRVGQKYGAIHEFGGTIVPKKAQTLAWQGPDGKMVFARKVRIPARPYMRPAIDENQGAILQAMSDPIDRHLKGAGS